MFLEAASRGQCFDRGCQGHLRRRGLNHRGLESRQEDLRPTQGRTCDRLRPQQRDRGFRSSVSCCFRSLLARGRRYIALHAVPRR
eukprot:7843489-Pyramimonas_sp.AAC.1